MQEHNEGHMKALLVFVYPMILLCVYMIYWYLLQIEINKTLTLPTGLESVGSHDDFAPKNKGGKQTSSSSQQPPEVFKPSSADNHSAIMEAAADILEHDDEDDDGQPRRFKITKLRNMVLVLLSLGLSLLTYLILVVTSAPFWLSLLGVGTIIAMGLFQQVTEEIRRQRLDRITAIVTLIFLAASFMSLATFAHKSLLEGEVYQGKARIVRFDNENYDNKQGEVQRTDLEVAWGGEWGCPTEHGKTCQAIVKYAMCESEEEDEYEADDDDDDGGKRRQLNDNNNNNGDGDDNKEDEEAEQQNENENEEEAEQQNNEGDDVAQENEELEEENEELEEDLEDYEDYADELEKEVAEEYTYYWDDDQVVDSYWDDLDWGNVWGGYSCSDLFEFDMSGQTYDAEEAPGNDDWPFVNIYGNCKKCEAYIVDYYSTEHFQSIQEYRIQGQHYLMLSVLGLILTALLHFKHKTDPIAEKELELLPNDGGALA